MKNGVVDIKWKKKLMVDKDEDDYEPEDDLICERLTEGVVKNIEIRENELDINIINGLEFPEDKNINNKQEGNLDVLDLISIFSASSWSDNSKNNENNNSQSPFDILNIPLNQNNNKYNNNPKYGININDILNMVIGTNSINNTVDINNNNKQNTKAELNSMKECYKNEDISIYYIITKKEANSIDGSIYSSNNKNIEINNIKISFLVQKFIKLTVLATSRNKLEPSQSLGIYFDFIWT